jgi:ribosome biogenesis GTPase
MFCRRNTVPSRTEKQWEHHQEHKTLRKVRNQLKRNRKRKRVRQREWRELCDYDVSDALDDPDLVDQLDIPQRERVVPRGERERRQAMIDAALRMLNETADGEPLSPLPGQEGLVIEVSTGLCRVQLDDRTVVCGVRGSLSATDTGYTNVVAVGDRVRVVLEGAEDGAIEQVLPRRSVLARPDVFHRHLSQVVVANADQLLIVVAWREPKLWPELIDRYIIAAQRSELTPILCVNKVDLAERTAVCRKEVEPYLTLGYRTLFTSALNGEGIDELERLLRGRTTVLAGMSGVGKSTLLNAIQGGLDLRTAEVSEYSHTGRHTTSQVNLIRLDVGGYVVDTPGIREFGLSGLRQGELVRFYPEIAALKPGCRFADCTHSHEPGCAVRLAARQGRLSAMRLQNYQRIRESLPRSLADEREQAQERAWR